MPNIWRLGEVRDTKFGTDVPNELLLNAAKCQYYSFYRFRIIKGKPRGGGGGKINPPTQIRVKNTAPIRSCMSKINNTFIGNAEDLDIVMPVYNDNYSMTAGSLWNYYGNEINDDAN